MDDPKTDPKTPATTNTTTAPVDTPPAPPATTFEETEAPVYSNLPKGALTLDQAIARAPEDAPKNAGSTPEKKLSAVNVPSGMVSAPFTDDFVGKGGTYAFNAKGERVQVHEAFVDADGNEAYRPIR